MTGDEWLNIQDIFALFLGRWIIIYTSVALATAVARALIGLVWRRPQIVRVVGRDDDE